MARIGILVLLILAGFLATSLPTKVNDLGWQSDKVKGLSFVAPPDSFHLDPFVAVEELSANWISVIPYAYTPSDKPVLYYNRSKRQWWGERPEGIRSTIQLAKTNGLHVMLRPSVYVPRGWTGTLQFDDEGWEQWEPMYAEYILFFAEMAEQLGVEMFCVGNEFKHSVQNRTTYWRSLIREVRSVFSGKICYAANWDAYHTIPIWDAVDYVGINAYFPLTDEETPRVKDLIKFWKPVEQEIDNFYSIVKKPILFTEYGYLSVDGAAHKTWELEKKIMELNINEEAQANALEALYHVFWDKPYWYGGFLWKWFPNDRGHEGYLTKDYTPQGKIAESVVKRWFTNR